MSEDNTDDGEDSSGRVVVLDGETGTELLTDGETTATLLVTTPDYVENVRMDVKVINTAGPHPLYRPRSETTDRPLWKRALPHALTLAVVAITTAVTFAALPELSIAVNGSAASVAPTWTDAAAVFIMMALIYGAVQVVPPLGRHSG